MDADGSVDSAVFVAGEARFVVECDDASMRDLVDAVLVDLRDDSAEPDHRLRLESRADGTHELSVSESDDFPAQAAAGAIGALVTAVTRLALDCDPEHLHLHAAAVAHDGAGLLVPGPSGYGKSTLAAALVQRGWSYTTDESVTLDADTMTCAGFHKPIVLKPGSPLTVRSGAVEAAASSVASDEAERWPVPASELTDRFSTSILPRAIAFLAPTASFDDDATLEEVHPADMVVAMLGQTLDAHRFGSRTLEVLAHLAASANCVQLQPGPLDQMCDVLTELIAWPTPSRSVSRLSPTGTESNWIVRDGVVSILIDDRVVVHELGEGHVAALDDAGSAVWLALHGSAPSWLDRDAFDAPPIAQFLGELEALSFLERVDHGDRAAAV